MKDYFEFVALMIREDLRKRARLVANAEVYKRNAWTDLDGNIHKSRVLTTDEVYARLKMEVIAILSAECQEWTKKYIVANIGNEQEGGTQNE